MTKAEINKMTADECFKAIEKIECKVYSIGREFSVAEKKLIAAIDKRLDDLMPEVED